MAYAENFILVYIDFYCKHNLLSLSNMFNWSQFPLPPQPVGEAAETKSMYKEVVLGGDVWDLLDELMIYMRNPMQYYEKEVKFVRVMIKFSN